MKKIILSTLVPVIAFVALLSGASAAVAAPVNLVTNGDFESPVVTDPALYYSYPASTPGIGWTTKRVLDDTDSALELIRGVNGWLARDGAQFAELDGLEADYIYQDIATEPGASYQLSFSFSPSPGTASSENVLDVVWNGSSVDTLNGGAGGSNTAWTDHVYTVTATGATTRLQFADMGSPDVYSGTLLDRVSLVKIPARISCPIPAASGRVIVNFDPSVKLYFGGPVSAGPIAAAIPAGDYTVRMVSWDGYLGRELVSQPHEQWYATVEDGSGVLATTATISDVPDNITEATVDEAVNTVSNLLHVPSAGTQVFARHAYPDSDINSVHPVCVSFDPVDNHQDGGKVKITVSNSNNSVVVNNVVTSASTGGNSAVGGSASSSGFGGNTSSGGSAGLIQTGNAGANSSVTNVVGSNVTRVQADCGCAGSAKIKVSSSNHAFVGSSVSTGASTGGNSAVGGNASNSGFGGNVASGGSAGMIQTGTAASLSDVRNFVGKNKTIIVH